MVVTPKLKSEGQEGKGGFCGSEAVRLKKVLYILIFENLYLSDDDKKVTSISYPS